MEQSLVGRLRVRAAIRRQIPNRKSVQENKPDRIAALLEEAADALESLVHPINSLPSNRKTMIYAPSREMWTVCYPSIDKEGEWFIESTRSFDDRVFVEKRYSHWMELPNHPINNEGLQND